MMKDLDFETLDNRVKLITEFVNDPYKAPECKYSLILEVINGDFDSKKSSDHKEVVSESSNKFTREDLASNGTSIQYLGSFDSVDDMIQYLKDHTLDSTIAYVYRLAPSNQFFGHLKTGGWGDITHIINDIMAECYGMEEEVDMKIKFSLKF